MFILEIELNLSLYCLSYNDMKREKYKKLQFIFLNFYF